MKVQGIDVPHSGSIWEKHSGQEVLFIQGKKKWSASLIVLAEKLIAQRISSQITNTRAQLR